MKAVALTAGTTGRIGQYNDLMEDARAASYVRAHEQSTPNLTLYVEPGKIYFNNTLVEYAGGNSPSFTAPVSNPRIDVLCIDSTGTLQRVAGTENASPVAPSVNALYFPLCRVYNRVSQTTLRDVDQSPNNMGYIQKDVRAYLHHPFKRRKGGRGTDGALLITSGTTTLSFASTNLLFKEYTSIDITGTGSLGFSNPATNGSIANFKVQNDVNITSSATRAIDLRLMGAPGGAGYVAGSYICGDGGRGGGSINFEIGGAWNFTGTIDTSGGNGTNASTAGAIAGGGGPGGGGSVTVTCETITANSGTINTAVGSSGTSITGGGCTGTNNATSGTNSYASVGVLAGGSAQGGATNVTTAPLFFTTKVVGGFMLIAPGAGGGGGGASGCSTSGGGQGTGASVSSGAGYSLVQTWAELE